MMNWNFPDRRDFACNDIIVPIVKSDEDKDENEKWFTVLERLRDNDPRQHKLKGCGENNYPRSMTDREWEELGHDISRSGYLECVGRL